MTGARARCLVAFLVAAAGFAVPVAAQTDVDEPIARQSPGMAPRVSLDAGVVMGIIFQPYMSVGMSVNSWAFRASGTLPSDFGSGLQLNFGRVLRDEGNATHTLGVMWAQYVGDRWFWPGSGRYAGVAYDFQVKGFFIETGAGVGAKNPVAPPALRHVYGQVGYVHRLAR